MTCATCGQAVDPHTCEPTAAMLDAALVAYRETSWPGPRGPSSLHDREADHVEAMREAITAALCEAAT